MIHLLYYIKLYYNIIIYNVYCNILGFPGGSAGKESVARWETRVQSLGWEDTLKKRMATQSSILAWRIPWPD